MGEQDRSRRVASAARLIGDDLQHTVSFARGLEALLPHSNITEIELEARDAGNLDDVVVRFADGRRDFHQVKGSVDSSRSLTLDWLTQPTRAGGPSILRRFHEHWCQVRDTPSKLSLITSRPISQDDDLVRLLDQTDTLGDVLAAASSNSKVGGRREELCSHLNVTEPEVIEFMSNLTIEAAGSLARWTERAKLLLAAAGFDDTNAAVEQGVAWVRERIERGLTRIEPADVDAALSERGLRRHPPAAVVVINEIDRHPTLGHETVTLDWLDHFPGSEPARRRLPDTPDRWSQQLQELQDVVDRLRMHDERHILVAGAARLPTWFAAGSRLSDVAGFHIRCHQRDQLWTSYADSEQILINVSPDLDKAEELAVAIALATDPSPDVDAFLRQADIEATRVTFAPEEGPNRHALDRNTAMGTARAVRDRLRVLSRELAVERIHLFLAAPHGFALLLGHLWDRLPTTTVYADAGVGNMYCPAYRVG